jgi:hypothetical protein
MSFKKLKNYKTNFVTKDPNSIAMIVNNANKAKFQQNLKKFGGTRTSPKVKAGCLIGHEANMLPLVMDLDQATKMKEITTLTGKIIWNCSFFEELKVLEESAVTAAATAATTTITHAWARTWSNSSRREEEAMGETEGEEEKTPTQTNTKGFCIISIPILGIQAFECITHDPLRMILIIKNAAIDIKNSHKNATDFEYYETKVVAMRMMKWLHAALKRLINEATIFIGQDNNSLQAH